MMTGLMIAAAIRGAIVANDTSTGTDAPGWMVGAGVLIGALSAALVALWTSWGRAKIADKEATAKIGEAARKEQARNEEVVRKGQAKERKDSLLEWQTISQRLQDQIDRYDAVVRQNQETIQAITEEHAECREDYAQSRSAIHFLYQHLQMVYSQAEQNGVKLGDMPELPPMREPSSTSRSEFLRRQTAQSVELLRESTRAIQAPSVTPPPPTKKSTP